MNVLLLLAVLFLFGLAGGVVRLPSCCSASRWNVVIETPVRGVVLLNPDGEPTRANGILSKRVFQVRGVQHVEYSVGVNHEG